MNEDRRLERNLKILEKLEKYFKSHPALRFNQGLINLGLTTWQTKKCDVRIAEMLDYEQESWQTLDIIKSKIDQNGKTKRIKKNEDI